MNCGLFVLNALLLYRLGRATLNNETIALRAAMLYCFNPASIFFVAAYSESLFCFFAFSGMLVLATAIQNANLPSGLSRSSSDVGDDSVSMVDVRPGTISLRVRLLASAIFALATMTRSNGALLGMFSLWAAWFSFQRDTSPNRISKAILELMLVTVIHLSALFSVLGYAWSLYCLVPESNRRPWCESFPPNVYNFVQKNYWNVGFLKYYEQKQIPNFALAAPAFAMSISAVINLAISRTIPLAYLAQLTVCILVGALFIHVQVFTRLVCASCPAFYWFAAQVTLKKNHHSYLVVLYFVLYAVLGSAMFCSYFPWT